MVRKTSRRAAASKRKKSIRKGRKSAATKRASGATAQSTPASLRKSASVEDFVRCIRTLHDLGLVQPFVQSAKRSKLTLTMDAAAFERVKISVNRLRQPAIVSASIHLPTSAAPSPDNDPFDFGSRAPGGMRHGVKPFPDDDPWDF